MNYLKNYKRLYPCLIFVFCWILKVLTKAIHMGNKITVHITKFKSCHQVAKLEAESSKKMQELGKHKHSFFSFMQNNMDLTKPRWHNIFCSRTGSSQAPLLVFPQDTQAQGLLCTQQWSQHCQLRGIAWPCQTQASICKTTSYACKESSTYIQIPAHPGGAAC